MNRFAIIILFLSLLLFPPSGVVNAVTYMEPAVATVTEVITPVEDGWQYTYTLNNLDSKGIYWWGMWFDSNPRPYSWSESNDRDGWSYNGNNNIPFIPFSGPSGELGTIYTFDTAITDNNEIYGYQVVTSLNRINPGETNVFQFTSATYFPGAKNFYYNTTGYWAGWSVEKVGTATLVPVSPAILLFGSGLLGLGIMGYRKKRS